MQQYITHIYLIYLCGSQLQFVICSIFSEIFQITSYLLETNILIEWIPDFICDIYAIIELNRVRNFRFGSKFHTSWERPRFMPKYFMSLDKDMFSPENMKSSYTGMKLTSIISFVEKNPWIFAVFFRTSSLNKNIKNRLKKKIADRSIKWPQRHPNDVCFSFSVEWS